MKRLVFLLASASLFFSASAQAAPCNGGWCLLCRSELAGPLEEVKVRNASTFREACQAVRDDPEYGYYNWQSCMDSSKPVMNCREELGGGL